MKIPPFLYFIVVINGDQIPGSPSKVSVRQRKPFLRNWMIYIEILSYYQTYHLYVSTEYEKNNNSNTLEVIKPVALITLCMYATSGNTNED